MPKVEKWPDILLKSCDVHTVCIHTVAMFIYVSLFFNIMHERVSIITGRYYSHDSNSKWETLISELVKTFERLGILELRNQVTDLSHAK